jgi:hypothetical protein
MTAMTLVLKFNDSLVKGVQIVFQMMDFALNGEQSSWKISSRWFLLCTRDQPARSFSLGGHGFRYHKAVAGSPLFDLAP